MVDVTPDYPTFDIRRLSPPKASLSLPKLIHDAMGERLTEWGDRQRDSFTDAMSSLVVSRGDQISGSNPIRKPSVVDNINWWGCWIGPTHEEIGASVQDVDFVNCDLRGTLFDRCRIENVRFTNCQMNGTLFRSCNLSRVTFSGCVSEGLSFYSGTMRDVEFRGEAERCLLEHLILGGVTVEGLVECVGLTVWSASIYDIQSSPKGAISFRDCTVQYCRGDESAKPAVKIVGKSTCDRSDL